MDKKIGGGRSYRVKYAREAVSVIYTNLKDYLTKLLNLSSISFGLVSN
jgi:hypothetical protein